VHKQKDLTHPETLKLLPSIHVSQRQAFTRKKQKPRYSDTV
ncbi:14807_t:CDS:1, partial [Dentiscutata erythropus]